MKSRAKHKEKTRNREKIKRISHEYFLNNLKNIL
jgi:hypothetical protein